MINKKNRALNKTHKNPESHKVKILDKAKKINKIFSKFKNNEMIQ